LKFGQRKWRPRHRASRCPPLPYSAIRRGCGGPPSNFFSELIPQSSTNCARGNRHMLVFLAGAPPRGRARPFGNSIDLPRKRDQRRPGTAPCTFVGDRGSGYPPFRGNGGGAQFDTTFPHCHENLSCGNRQKIEEHQKATGARGPLARRMPAVRATVSPWALPNIENIEALTAVKIQNGHAFGARKSPCGTRPSFAAKHGANPPTNENEGDAMGPPRSPLARPTCLARRSR